MGVYRYFNSSLMGADELNDAITDYGGPKHTHEREIPVEDRPLRSSLEIVPMGLLPGDIFRRGNQSHLLDVPSMGV